MGFLGPGPLASHCTLRRVSYLDRHVVFAEPGNASRQSGLTKHRCGAGPGEYSPGGNRPAARARIPAVNTWKVIVATIVIFVTGAVTGALIVGHSIHPRPGPGGVRLEFLRRMERDLDLTKEQREKTDKILKESQEQTRRIMEPVAPALHAELQRTKEEFRQVLTPAQQARFDQLLKHPPRSRDSHRSAGVSEPPPLTNSPPPVPGPQ